MATLTCDMQLQVRTLDFVIICASLIAMANVFVVIFSLANVRYGVAVTFAVAIDSKQACIEIWQTTM